MRLARFAAMMLLALGSVDAAPAAPGAMPEPIVWRQNVFSIPYRVHSQPRAEGAPVEVQLFVSDDAGKSWQLAGRTAPTEPSFTFNAAHDGEFWFSLRTIDRTARVAPTGPHRPGLRVIVDTLQPVLDLQAAPVATGAVEVRWRALDANLKLDSLKIEVRSGANASWQPLAIGHPPVNVRGARSGQATWWPQGETGRVTIRAEVIDRAGNRSVTQSEVHLQRQTPPTVAAAPVSNGNSLWPQPSASTAAEPISSPPALTHGGQSWPADQVTQAPVGSEPPGTAQPPSSAYPQWRPGAPATVPPRVSQLPMPQSTHPTSMVMPPQDVPTAVGPPPPDAYLPGQPPGQPPIQPNVAPPATDVRMIGTNEFELDYNVQSVGRYGVSKVELWGSRDGGHTWESFGVDNDNRSPIRARVDRDGLYGFLIVVEGTAGAAKPPQSGQTPGIWVHVDRTLPVASLLSVEQVAGDQIGSLLVRWEATDEHLTPRPVSLFWSAKPGGPWAVLVAGLENTGQHTLPIDQRMPDQFYLRLAVRDAAGNVRSIDSIEPIALLRPQPQAQIRGVHPLGPPSSLVGPEPR